MICRDYSAETENSQRNLQYLHKIHDFCREREIQLMLFLTPTKGPIPADAQAVLEQDIAALQDAVFVDFNAHMDALQIDDRTDWFDFLHFNCQGAEKFSQHLAQYLRDVLELGQTEREDEILWQSRVDSFDSRRTAAVSSQKM